MILSGKRIAFRKLETPKKESTIILLEEEETYVKGEVITIGDECKPEVKKAKTVLVNKGGIEELDWEGEKCHIVLEDMLMGYE